MLEVQVCRPTAVRLPESTSLDHKPRNNSALDEDGMSRLTSSVPFKEPVKTSSRTSLKQLPRSLSAPPPRDCARDWEANSLGECNRVVTTGKAISNTGKQLQTESSSAVAGESASSYHTGAVHQSDMIGNSEGPKSEREGEEYDSGACAEAIGSSPDIPMADNFRSTLGSTPVIRPLPVKSTLSGASVEAQTPIKGFGILEAKTDALSTPDTKAKHLPTKPPQTRRAAQLASLEKERVRKERQARHDAEVKRLQAGQCDFPETSDQLSLPAPTRNAKTTGSSPGFDKYRHSGVDDSHSIIQIQTLSARQAEQKEQRTSAQCTPMFQQLVTEDVQEAKAYQRLIRTSDRRMAGLERVKADLENRLRMQARMTELLETTMETKEREWRRDIEDLEKELSQWRKQVAGEKAKNVWLHNQMNQREQEIRRMLQRKYDHDRRSGRGAARPPNETTETAEASGSHGLESPNAVWAALGSSETVRLRNMTGLLAKFFGV